MVGYLGFSMNEEDLRSVDRIHSTFIRSGLDLRFTTYDRPPQWYYPTFEELLLERDLDDRHANYLGNEEDFQFLRGLQVRDRVIPVVGDLAGDHALRAIGEEIEAMGETVSAIYTSNVEFYLWQAGTFSRFANTLTQLPFDEESVLIRSYFSSIQPHPGQVDGYVSTQLLQRMPDFVERHASGGYASYWDLVTDRPLEFR